MSANREQPRLVCYPPHPPAATIAAFHRHWEHLLEEEYGGKWTLRVDPEHAGEITYWGGAADDSAVA